MAATPWLTSSGIIESIKRKISMPIAQTLMTEDDILRFVNEEVAISQIPAVMQYHEEYLVYTKTVPLRSNKSRYAIPDRAIGMKLRDLFWQDSSGNLFGMSQITEEDKAFFQRSIGANQAVHKYYIENNDVVLSPSVSGDATGYLVFCFFLRPNQLVKDERAAIISGFSKTITVNNASLVAGDTVTVGSSVFTAVSGSPSVLQFQIGASDIATATSLAQAINTVGEVSANNGSPSTSVVTVSYQELDTTLTSSNTAALTIQATQGIVFNSIPSNITSSSYVDFLQTKPGHKIRTYDVLIPINGVSSSSISFRASEVPEDLVVGDYVCTANECIIPQLPPELHNGLAERAAARILAAMGDVAGLQMSSAKIEEINKSEGTLLDNRVDGSPRKITAKYSLLRWGRLGTRRRF